MKRKDYITWDEYFMGISLLSAHRSKDPSTQVGCCIVDNNKKIVSVGYNGLPKGCSDDDFPWNREASDSYDSKYAYVCHAELNAILNSRTPVVGCTLYVSLFPCNECAKAIIQSGIAEVVYMSDKYADTSSTKSSKRMLLSASVKCRQMSTTNKKIVVEL